MFFKISSSTISYYWPEFIRFSCNYYCYSNPFWNRIIFLAVPVSLCNIILTNKTYLSSILTNEAESAETCLSYLFLLELSINIINCPAKNRSTYKWRSYQAATILYHFALTRGFLTTQSLYLRCFFSSSMTIPVALIPDQIVRLKTHLFNPVLIVFPIIRKSNPGSCFCKWPLISC